MKMEHTVMEAAAGVDELKEVFLVEDLKEV